MSLEKAFGKVLKEQREKRNLTQLQLAERCDFDVTYISLLERGRRQPSLKAFIRIATALDSSPVEILKKTLKALQA